jgi:hypothetical protein
MKKLPDEIAMFVDDNFQFGIDFFLITVVIHQIFLGTARSACHSSNKHLQQFHLKYDVLCRVKQLVHMRRHHKTRQEKCDFEEDKHEFAPMGKYLVEYVVNKRQSVNFIA